MKKLKIAVQKSGRLLEDSIEILSQCGIKLPKANGKLKSEASGFPLEVYYLRNNDIPKYVDDGIVDVAIVGTNTVEEYHGSLDILLPLGFSKCKVSIAVPKTSTIYSIEDLKGKKIATSYPNTLEKYLKQSGVDAEIHFISGSVEIAPTLGLADAICDIVSTGSTLLMNGLKPIETIFLSEAALVSRIGKDEPAIKDLMERLVFRLKAYQRSRQFKYVLLNAPNHSIDKIKSIIPGMKSPTILPLAMAGWSSIHSVIAEDDFWQHIDALKSAGAEGILIVPIEKMIL